MPCIDGRDDPGYDRGLSAGQAERQNLRTELALVTAIACGALTALQGPDGVDWDEVGVSKEIGTKWWNRHKKRDAERRRREADEKQRADSIALLQKKLRETFSLEEIALLIKAGGL